MPGAPQQVIDAAAQADTTMDAMGQPQPTDVNVAPTVAPQVQQAQQPAQPTATPTVQVQPVVPPVSLADLTNQAAQPSPAVPAPIQPLATGAPAQPQAPAAPAPSTISQAEYDRVMAELAKERAHAASIQGKYDAEVPILHQRLHDIGTEVNQARAERDTAVSAINDPEAFKKYLQPEELADYATPSDALGVSGKAAVGISQTENQKLRQEMDTRLQKIETDAAATRTAAATSSILQRVDVLSPGASKINAQPAFKAFLQEIDPVSGQPYLALGNSAFASQDITRIAGIFDAFKTMAGITQEADAALNRQVDGQIKPSPVAGSSTPVAQQKPKIYRSQINQHVKDCRLGVYGPDPETNPEYIKVDNLIDDAALDGRIVEDV